MSNWKNRSSIEHTYEGDLGMFLLSLYAQTSEIIVMELGSNTAYL